MSFLPLWMSSLDESPFGLNTLSTAAVFVSFCGPVGDHKKKERKKNFKLRKVFFPDSFMKHKSTLCFGIGKKKTTTGA